MKKIITLILIAIAFANAYEDTYVTFNKAVNALKGCKNYGIEKNEIVYNCYNGTIEIMSLNDSIAEITDRAFTQQDATYRMQSEISHQQN